MSDWDRVDAAYNPHPDRPLPGQVRCLFVGGPLDGKHIDVDAYTPSLEPPDWITCADPLQRAMPEVEHVYVRDGDVEDVAGVGRRLRMRYDRQQNKFMTYEEMRQARLRGPAPSGSERMGP